MHEPVWTEQIETALVDRLKEGVTAVELIRPFPGKSEKFDFAGLNSTILVAYSGSRYRTPEGNYDSSQPRAMEFVLLLLVRDLSGHGGAYHLLDETRKAVQGSVFEGAGPAVMDSEKLNRQSESHFEWEMRFTLPTQAVARHRSDPANLMRPQLTTQTETNPWR